MINIVHTDIHCDDERKVTAIDIKLKSIPGTDGIALFGHQLSATISGAFFKTTIFNDVSKSLGFNRNTDRNDIIDLTISINRDDPVQLSFQDVANFLKAFQEALDTTDLGF